MQETLSLCLGKQQETLSTYPEQIRNWNELRSVKVKLRYEVKCGGVATYAPAWLSITENANVASTAKLQSRYKAINISTKPF